MMQRIAKSTSTRVMIDPRSGQRLEPLGVIGNRVIWPIMGGAPDDDEDGEDEDSDADDDTDDDGDDDASGDKDKKKKEDEHPRVKELADESARHRRQRNEAREERDRLRRELEELKGKDTPELEKIQTQVATLTTENEQLRKDLQEARLNNAFLSNNKYEWADPADALKLADLSEVEMDDDGNVSGLREALDKLSKEKPHLLKKKVKKQDDDNEDEERPATGHNPGGRSNKDKGQLDRAKLQKKYPALRR